VARLAAVRLAPTSDSRAFLASPEGTEISRSSLISCSSLRFCPFPTPPRHQAGKPKSVSKINREPKPFMENRGESGEHKEGKKNEEREKIVQNEKKGKKKKKTLK
jgi:hypothetical protein